MKKAFIYFTVVLVLAYLGCGSKNVHHPTQSFSSEPDFIFDSAYIATRFRLPIGNPPGKGYYDAQSFMKNTHLGEDWNGTGGGNSDLGDTIYACANGYVHFAEDIYSGWGNVIRILHVLPAGKKWKQVESLYAHMDTLLVKAGTYVHIGDPIGTIGTNHGHYYAHLHFEMRHDVNMEVGGGYSSDTTGFLEPKKFIKEF